MKQFSNESPKLPSTEEMRRVISENDTKILQEEGLRLTREYTILFEKFKQGVITEDEQNEMGKLVEKINEVKRKLGVSEV